MDKLEQYRIEKVIEDLKITRVECNWIDDQTNQSFRDIIEKGEKDKLYLELIWGIGQELAGYYDVQWPVSFQDKDLLLSFKALLSQSELISTSTHMLTNDFHGRLWTVESLFLQLQLIQLELFDEEIKDIYQDEDQDGKRDIEMSNNTDEDMGVDEDEELINYIAILAELFSIQFENTSNLALVLQEIYKKVQDTLTKLPKDYISEPFFKNTSFTDAEIAKVQEISDQLYKDYSMRCDVLTKRMNVTVDSLLWSERVESKLDEIRRTVRFLKSRFTGITHYKFTDLISVHRDILRIIKTSLNSKSTKLTNSVIIGKVPDRGGRPGDKKAAMPSFHKRVDFGNQNQGYKRGRK